MPREQDWVKLGTSIFDLSRLAYYEVNSHNVVLSLDTGQRITIPEHHREAMLAELEKAIKPRDLMPPGAP